MPAGTFNSSWRNERLGLVMIAASLLVIGLIAGVSSMQQREAKEAHIREAGVTLARLVSRLFTERPGPQVKDQGILAIVQHAQTDADLAYLAIVDGQGSPLLDVSSPGVVVPAAPVPETPTAWLGERLLTLSASQRAVQEFHAPWFKEGELAGHVRVGYFKPGLDLGSDQLPFVATLALPIFLLTPLFYFLIRNEIRPLKRVNEQLDELMQQGEVARCEVSATGELADFMQRFNQFIEFNRARLFQLESEQADMITSTKLLSYRKSRIETVLQSLPDAVIVLDETGAVSMANSRVATLLGIDHETIVGNKPGEWCDVPDVVAFLAKYEGKMSHGRQCESLEFVPVSAPEKTLVLSAYPLFSPKDASQILGTLVVFRDMTAEHLARRSSGEFVAHVAHELKTPLNVIAMYSEELQGGGGLDESFRVEATNVIHDEVERLAMLINNLLSITKIETGSLAMERQRIKLHDLLKDAFATVSRDGRGKDLNFHLDLPKEISALWVDKDLMRIAINNLLTNAIKYNREGGTVSLVAEETEGVVRIAVRDTGFGIAPEDQQRIFDKFYRSERDEIREKSGHGLGLSLAREIVQLHHGTLTLHSELGEGTEFVIEFNKQAGLLKEAV